MLTVYKASAGSGKTFHLVVEYLKLLIESPGKYKQILAVTFTNKATNEMKSRILDQLNRLATGDQSDYLSVITGELDLSEDLVRKRAKQALTNVLHDYNHFSINTIDSFTQRVIKAFNREMGISPNFSLELDNSMILEEATDRLLAKLDTDKKLRDWLVKFSEEKIKDNYSQRIEDDIKLLGKELFNERFQLFFPENDNSVYTRDNLDKFLIELQQITGWFENTIKTYAQKAVSAIRNNGFDFDDFTYKLGGVAGYLKNLSEGNIKEPGKRVLDAAENSEKWFTAKHPEKEKLGSIVENNLRPELIKILSFYTGNSIKYYTAVAVKKQLRMLGILTDLKEEVKELLHEKGALQISDSNLLLSKIIGNSDSPFIYEKIGSRYSHFMLDEFQDTSALQWNNFKPLVANSLAEGNLNLLVGDIKQSIYRWRNSDWNILATEITEAFPGFPPTERPLEKNWRSDKNIIDFNNAMVESLLDTFESKLLMTEIDSTSQPEYIEKFRNIYKHFHQEPGDPNKNESGFVNINFLPEEDFENTSVQKLVEEVKQLQDNGLSAREIAILIRKNSEGSKIIDAFLDASEKPENSKYNLSVISNESLFLFASQGVNFIMGVIELLLDPENKIIKAFLIHTWKTWLKPELESKGISLSASSTQQFSIDFDAIKEDNWQLTPQFEEEFETELQPLIEQAKQKVLLSSLDETIVYIANIFSLFKIESELPFYQTLIDKSAEIKTTISNDLSNLLFWWKESGYKTSVSVNEDTDSIRLLTVHKAKGLEYAAVLMPNFNWDSSWSGNLAPTLWCKVEAEPFNRFPLLPVRAAKNLESTWFKHDFYEEKVSSFIDTMNLIYVAFTRAKSVLLIHCKEQDKKTKSINRMLKSALNDLSQKELFKNSWNDEQTAFRFGTMPYFKTEENKLSSSFLNKYAFSDYTERIKLRINSDGFLIEGKMGRSVKNTGKLLHDILSTIESINDIKTACRKALSQGKINKTELSEIEFFLHLNLEKPEVKHWFDGSYKIANERNLLAPDRVYRPDRIMISGNHAIIVDYKLGEKNPAKYNYQVKKYSEILKDTGIENVEGYLWYINRNEIEKVCEL